MIAEEYRSKSDYSRGVNTMANEPMNNEKDEALFRQVQALKKRKQRRVTITVVSIVALVLIAIAVAVVTLQAKVRTQFASNGPDVKTYQAKVGRISTLVSGTGTLESVDAEEITLPAGVEVEEVLVSAGDTLKAGDAIATVKSASVMTALASAQDKLDDLDDQISKAKNDSVSSYLSSGVSGRVKKVYAQAEDNVVDVMTEHGALALLSLDGLMCVTVDAQLEPQAAVTVVTSDGLSYPGTVESAAGSRSTVTLTDNGPKYRDTVTVQSEGAAVGTGVLEIHNPLAITGYAGTVRYVNAKENQLVYTGSSLFSLTNTGYTANYDSLLQERTKTENTLNTLIALLRTGNLEAGFDGTVSSVDYSEDAPITNAAGDTVMVTMAPDESICVNVGIDETDILSLALGQTAEVTVSSVSDEPMMGTVTEITKVGTSTSGVTQYSAVVTLPKDPKMLSGMSATVDIQIQGVDDVVLIPVDALHTTRNVSFVYTSYNEETKEYADRVDVVTGASNSNFVEIVSGLKEGDTVYYTERVVNNFFMMPGMTGRNNSSRTGSNGSNRSGGSGNRNGGGNPPQGNRPGMGG